MKKCNRCKVEKTFSEFHRRKSGWASICKECKSVVVSEYRKRNLEIVRARSLQWHHENKEQSCANTKAWRAANREKRRDAWCAWRDANRDVVRDLKARRRAVLKRAMPSWADRAAIRRIYTEAVQRSVATGVMHNVDHIIPLQHPLVCGLHVESNLQIITMIENQQKYNKWMPPGEAPERAPDIGRAVGQ